MIYDILQWTDTSGSCIEQRSFANDQEARDFLAARSVELGVHLTAEREPAPGSRIVIELPGT